MAFNIQHDGDDRSITVTLRTEALTVVSNWLKGGRTGIRVVGDGRVYTAEEFAATVINDIRSPDTR